MSPDDQRSTAALEVVVTDARGRRLRAPALVRWLRAVAPARARGTVCVAFVTDAAMRRLNREFAGHDYVTDVLSFAADDEVRPSTGARPSTQLGTNPSSSKGRGALSNVEGRKSAGPEVRKSLTPGRPDARTPGRSAKRHLGDVVIASGRAGRQAGEAGHSLETELRILALHGLLHLLGYDHARDAGQMARLESRLRRKGGLAVGLIERANRGRGEDRGNRATSVRKPESRKPRAESRRGRA